MRLPCESLVRKGFFLVCYVCCSVQFILSLSSTDTYDRCFLLINRDLSNSISL